MISRKIEAAEWGDAVVDRLAEVIARTEAGLLGFTRRNLFRMRQFYEAYAKDPIVSPLVTQLPWSHHLIILEQCKRHPGEVEQAGARASVQGSLVRACCPEPSKSVTSGDTNLSGGAQHLS